MFDIFSEASLIDYNKLGNSFGFIALMESTHHYYYICQNQQGKEEQNKPNNKISPKKLNSVNPLVIVTNKKGS